MIYLQDLQDQTKRRGEQKQNLVITNDWNAQQKINIKLNRPEFYFWLVLKVFYITPW